MGIKLMVKMRIGPKIIFSYFLLLLVVFSVTAFSFRLLSQVYLIREAKAQLKAEGQVIAELLQNIPLESAGLREALLNRKQLRIAGRFLDSHLVVFNKEGKVIYSNLEAAERQQFIKAIQNNTERIKGFVVERVPVYSNRGESKAQVLLLTKLKDLEGLNLLIRRAQAFSFLIAGTFALVLGLFFARSLTRPIKLLTESMQNFSLKKSANQVVSIETGDEIAELAHCFNTMATRLRNYGEQQKRFLQNASHELKTPLMSIQGYAEAIKDGVVEGEEMKESLEIIIQESQRLKRVVEETIYLTKVEEAQESFEFKCLDIGQMMFGIVKSLKPLAEEKKIQFQGFEGTAYEVWGDEDKLARAFLNILSNGLRYARTTLSISARSRAKELEIEIRDDGPGLRQGEENRVFERFYKGEKGGTGIGLAIAKAIIEAHGGTIRAGNAEPQGAIFTLILPLGK